MSISGKIVTLIGILLAVGIAGAIVFTFIQNSPTAPKFSYDSSNIKGWWGGNSDNLQALARSLGNKYKGNEPIDKLPVADLTVHHGEKDAEKLPDDNCFVAFSYYDYPLDDVDAAYKDYEDRKKEQGELEILEPIVKTIPTFEGDKEYNLRQYKYTVKNQDALTGYEIGFLKLDEGHMRIEGVCKTTDDLKITFPVLNAVTLDQR